MTPSFIFVFKGDRLRRKHSYGNVIAAIVSASSSEIVVQNAAKKDLRIRGLSQSQVSEFLQILVAHGSTEKTLRIYEVPEDSLIKFVGANRDRRPMQLFPDEQYRQPSRERVGSDGPDAIMGSETDWRTRRVESYQSNFEALRNDMQSQVNNL